MELGRQVRYQNLKRLEARLRKIMDNHEDPDRSVAYRKDILVEGMQGERVGYTGIGQ